ncbi:hypothetical protein ABZW10_28435 [Kitasatospora sp. NPDC004723]|uniref:hypothetical protein n=1 Tax=Kitasatospora sp. NPDC004723 TaxID=3154288 RepID=UPI0033B5EEDD
MSHEIVTHMPAALRKFATNKMECETDGQFDLMNACKALDMGKSNNSTKVPLTNDALGALLDICREWLTSGNGNEVMAGKSVLNRHELDYKPEDPRERRHQFQLPNSLNSYVQSQITQGFLSDRPELLAELDACSYTSSGLSGRVTYITLGWLLDVARSNAIHGAGAIQRAGKKFVEQYTEDYEQTVRLVNGYLGTDDDQAPAEVEHQDQAEAPSSAPEWSSGPLRDVPGQLRSQRVRILYGGRAGARSPQPTEATPAGITYTGEGRYEITSLETGEELVTLGLSSKLWWARLDDHEQPPEVEVIEDQEPAEEAVPAQAGKSVGPVPANWVDLAATADTLTARAWWARRVASWGK